MSNLIAPANHQPPLFTNRRKVTFDIDDTLWPYTYQIAKMAGVDYADWIDFHTLNPNFTQTQKDAITEIYRSPEPYNRLIFYEGIEDILQLENYGAIVQFKSQSFTQELLDIKKLHLKTALPQLRPEQLILQTVSVEQCNQKDFDDDTFIIIDDNAYGVAKSKAPYAIIPQVPWNQTDKARALVAHKKVYYVPAGDLYMIYRIIVQLLTKSP